MDVSVSEGKLSLKKEVVSTGQAVFGKPDYGFKITASNSGVMPYERLAVIEDELPKYFWLTGEQLAALFEQDTEHQLTVTISRATICEPHDSQTVAGIDGSSTGSTGLQNTGSNTKYSGIAGSDPDRIGQMTITIGWGSDGKLQLIPGDGESKSCAVDGRDIQSKLDKLGFLVTAETRYKLRWDLTDENGDPVLLEGGKSVIKEIPCSIKDTFMLLNQDQVYRYPDQYGWRSYYDYDTMPQSMTTL